MSDLKAAKANMRAEAHTHFIYKEGDNLPDKKEKRITIRLSENEYRELKSKAQRSKMAVGTYVRIAALKHKVNVIEGAGEVLGELKGIGRNLNQITVLANMGKIREVYLKETKDALNAVYDKLDLILKEVR